MKEKIRVEQLAFLQRIKTIFSPPVASANQPVGLRPVSQQDLTAADTSASRVSDIRVARQEGIVPGPKFDELMKRIENLENFIENQPNPVEDDTARRSKIKEEIMSNLQQHRKLTSSQMANLIGMSRTRCNEYFRQLTREGRTEGVIINRQKYYKLTGR
jgi:hypothetical protein